MLPLLSTVRRKPELLSLRIINAEPRGLACSNLSLDGSERLRILHLATLQNLWWLQVPNTAVCE
jgi:hypothetical protein